VRPASKYTYDEQWGTCIEVVPPSRLRSALDTLLCALFSAALVAAQLLI
jgi:hypothetical protein